MKKLLSVILCTVFVLCDSAVIVRADEVESSAAAFELYCPDSGRALLSDHSDRQLPMASTTKIMTALMTLEAAAKENSIVTFTDEMTAEGSSMYLKTGEKVRLYDLAVGMMMQSGNDAANAAAIAIAGSLTSFAAQMNAKAKEIGMLHTHFVTPSGLDDAQHYSTAHDMALLMAYALQNKDFAEMTSRNSMTVDFVSPHGKSVTYPNHNRLLKMFDACIGGKTGYTQTAGRCLVSAARRDGMTLICVTLNDRDDWDDHLSLYEYGFSTYTSVPVKQIVPNALPVVGGVSDGVAIELEQDDAVIVEKVNADRITATVCLPAFVYAPVQQNEVAGSIVYTLDGLKKGEKKLFFSESVEENRRKRSFITYIKDLFNWHS